MPHEKGKSGQTLESVTTGRVHAMYKEIPCHSNTMKPLQCTSKSNKLQHTQVRHNTDAGLTTMCRWHCTGPDKAQKGPDKAQKGPDEAQRGPDEA